jgi:hypothetical protein
VVGDGGIHLEPNRRLFVAQRVEVVLVDDLDGAPADETVQFSLDGVSYQIDLTSGNAQALRDALAPYVGHARRTGGRRSAARKASGSSPGTQSAAIREWAREQGLPVNERGRIPADLVAKYEAAHS